MHLGKRPLREYHGLSTVGLYILDNKLLITKQNGKYQLYRNNAPVPDFESWGTKLDALIKITGSLSRNSSGITLGGDTSMAKLANATIPVEEASIREDS